MPNNDRHRLTRAATGASRRRILHLLGAGATAGLAGCNSKPNTADVEETTTQSDDTDKTDTGQNGESSGIEFPDRRFLYPKTSNKQNFKNLNWNRAGKNGIGHLEKGLTQALLFKYDLEKDSVGDWIATYELEGKSLRISLKQNMVWSDGSAVTGKDLALTFARDMPPDAGGILASVLEELTVVSDDPPAVELTLNQSVARQNLELELYNQALKFNTEQHGEFLEPLWKGGSKEERKEARKGLSNLHVNKEDYKASGMFVPKEVRPKRVILERNDKFPFADNINFGKLEYRAFGGSQQQWQSMQSGDLDFMEYHEVQGLGERAKDVPDFIEKDVVPGAGNISIVPQHLDSHLGNRAVRQAMAYALDRTDIASNCGVWFRAAPKLTGFTEVVTDKFIPGETFSQFTEYGPKSKPEKATQVLEDAGFTKQDGKWVTPDGEVVNTKIVSRTGTYWGVGARTASSQLKEFGFEAPTELREDTTYWSHYGSGEFKKCAVGWWGHGSSQLPYYQSWLTLQRAVPGKVAHWGIDVESLQTESGATPISKKVRVPMPVGDPNGSMEELNLKKRIDQLFVEDDEETIKQLVTEIAWGYNQFLPQLPMINGQKPQLLNKKGWDVPNMDEKPWDNYVYTERGYLPRELWRNGGLKATKK